jgi:choline dehydrogenase-like flavoprotein
MYDLAIYGSGFAAYSLAAPALERGYSIVVLEKGPQHDLKASLDLARVLSPWEPVESDGFDFGTNELNRYSKVPRFIGLGGTSALWSGKWRPLDRMDFRRPRDGRRWPFDKTVLEPHYRATARRYGFSFEDDSETQEVRLRAEAHGIRLVQIALPEPPVRLFDRWNTLEKSPHLRIVTNVQSLEFRIKGEAIARLLLRGKNGRAEEITARFHVIAAGGIASAELVRDLTRQATGSPVAFLRGYMDHPKGVVGLLRPTRNLDDLNRLLSWKGGANSYALSLPEDELLERGIGNHTLFMFGRVSRYRAASALLTRSPIKLVANVDQPPEPWNGITSTSPSAVYWRISSATRRDLNNFLACIIPRIEALFGKIKRSTWIELRAASHPAGCVPFSEAPSLYELYPDGRLATLSNAYCISAAGFPFAGSANPTMTVAALGDRLAEQLAPAPTMSP